MLILDSMNGFVSNNLCILLNAIIESAIHIRLSPIKAVTKYLIFAKIESSVNTVNDVRLCSVKTSVATDRNPAMVWLMKNRTKIVEIKNPRTRIRDISFLQNSIFVHKSSSSQIVNPPFKILRTRCSRI